MEKSREDIEREIIEFLDANSSKKGDPNIGCSTQHGLACALATAKDNMPRSTPIDYYSEGLDIWMVTTAGGKVNNIKANPNVALCIYTPMGDHSVRNRSVQIWGKATLLTYESDPEEFEKRSEIWGLHETTAWYVEPEFRKGKIPREKKDEIVENTLRSYYMIKVEPDTIIMSDVETDADWHKYTWKRGAASAETAAGFTSEKL